MQKPLWLTPVALVASLCLLGACDDPTELVFAGEDVHITVDLGGRIDPQSCLHILAPGEDFPKGQLCNGQTYQVYVARQVSLAAKKGGMVTFRAGRNGIILDSQSCRVGTGQYISTTMRVEWIGAGLVCENGWD